MLTKNELLELLNRQTGRTRKVNAIADALANALKNGWAAGDATEFSDDLETLASEGLTFCWQGETLAVGFCGDSDWLQPDAHTDADALAAAAVASARDLVEANG